MAEAVRIELWQAVRDSSMSTARRRLKLAIELVAP
jgi:hypothetical protein